MNISYDDFVKLEIRIGTILTAEVVPEADRLLKLTVDLGEESPRQIVSGIREHFAEAEALVGKQCPFIVNMEPRTIRGLESQGMIMAGGEADVFALLHPSAMVPAGTLVQ